MNKTHGFTLLEMLIGMTLVGFILMLLFSGLRLGTRVWEAGELRAAAASDRTVIIGFVRHAMEQAYPLRWRVDAEDVIAFAGEPESLAFVGPLSSREGMSGSHLLSLRAVAAGSGRDLVLRWRLPDPSDQDFSALENADSKVLVKGIKSATWSYFGTESGAAETVEPIWHDHWPNRAELPRLIRLRLTLDNGEVWPDIIVRPMIGSESGCVWDDFYKRCVDGAAQYGVPSQNPSQKGGR